MRRVWLKKGFSLIELLVVVTIVGILLAILIPALSAAREASRSTVCQNNLRQFGIALNGYADQHGSFCSGAFDWRRDGVPSEVGWVADCVNNGIPAGQMLCPSNPNQVGETYLSLLTDAPSTPGWSCRVNHAGSTPRKLPDGSLAVNPCRMILGAWSGNWTAPWGTTYTGGSPLTAGSEERRLLVEEMVYKAGYNSNYAASWWLARSGVSLTREGNLVQVSGTSDLGTSCPLASNLERTSTVGPLQRRLLDSNGAPSCNLPLLGDAGTVAASKGTLPHPIGPHPAGSSLVDALTDGPVENTTMRPPTFPPNTSRAGPNGWWTKWAKGTLQDYRDFAPVHRAHVNLLMADGSIRSYRDVDKDGLLNNGFDPAAFVGSGSIGFEQKSEEFPREEIVSGYSIKRGEISLNRP